MKINTNAPAHTSTTGRTTDDHHNQSHTVVSHSDTVMTGSEANSLVDGVDNILHSHSIIGAVRFAEIRLMGH